MLPPLFYRRNRRWICGLLPWVLFICVNSAASAEITINCGEAPKDVPITIQEELKGDVEGKAQLLTKLLGTAQIQGAVETSRTELYEQHRNLDQHQIDMYFMWIACQAIWSDKTISTSDKLKLWNNVYSAFPGNRVDQEKRQKIRVALGSFLEEGRRLMHRCADVTQPAPTGEAEAWAQNTEKFLHESLDDSYIARFRSSSGLSPVTENSIGSIPRRQLWTGLWVRTARLQEFIKELVA